jgi:hypothetical protein
MTPGTKEKAKLPAAYAVWKERTVFARSSGSERWIDQMGRPVVPTARPKPQMMEPAQTSSSLPEHPAMSKPKPTMKARKTMMVPFMGPNRSKMRPIAPLPTVSIRPVTESMSAAN